MDRTDNNTSAKATSLPSFEDFQDIVHRAQFGSEEALQELRMVLRQHPEIWQRVGDLAGQAKDQLIDMIAETSVLERESIVMHLDGIRKQIVSDTATPLEKLIMERIVVTYIDLAYHQIAADIPRETKKETGIWQIRLNKSQRRHFDAVRELNNLQKTLRDADELQEPTCAI